MATVSGIWAFNESVDLRPYSTYASDSYIYIYLTVPNYGFADTIMGKIIRFHSVGSGSTKYWQILFQMYTGDDFNTHYGNVILTNAYTPRNYSSEIISVDNEAARLIDFGTTPQEVPEEFYTWFTANATQQASEEGAGGATVAYNGADLLSLEAGQTGTLNCAGTKMAGDVVVSFEGVGSIAYNGSVIASLSAGQSATLYCAGKKMAGNIVITCDGGGSN